MKLQEIERFFSELGSKVNFSVQVIVTGGAAAVLYGESRATEDIDFEVAIPSKNWEKLNQSIREVSKSTGITPQFSDDIEEWSSIRFPNKKSQPYKKFGKVEVRILDPIIWAIGKLGRFLPHDEQDLIGVFKRHKPSPATAARLWGQALKKSLSSSSYLVFKKQVEYFFDTYGEKIWGRKGNPQKLKDAFLASARKA